jgi:hypothetical protein
MAGNLEIPFRGEMPAISGSVVFRTCNAPIEVPATDSLRSKRTMRILGILLISIGLLTLVLPYLTFTKREKVIDIGPVEAVAETKERIPISPVVGAVIFVAGQE